MSAQWSPSSSAPPPPSRRGSSSAFRDTLIIAGIAVAGVAGLVIWGGGDAPAAATPQDLTPGGVPVTVAPPGGPVAGPAAGEGDVAVAGADAPVAAGDGAVAVTAVTGTATPAGADYEVDVGMQDSLIGLLPIPATGTELPADGLGVRTWTVPGADWQAARDAYLAALTAEGYTSLLTDTIDDGTNVGELYTLTHSTGTTLQLAVGAFEGQSIVEVTRQ